MISMQLHATRSDSLIFMYCKQISWFVLFALTLKIILKHTPKKTTKASIIVINNIIIIIYYLIYNNIDENLPLLPQTGFLIFIL